MIAAIEGTEINGETVLHKAVKQGDIHIFTTLLSKLADETKEHNALVKQRNPDRRSAIAMCFGRPTLHNNLAHLAVKRWRDYLGNCCVVKALLEDSGLTDHEKSVLLNAEDEKGRKPVDVTHNHKDIAERERMLRKLKNWEYTATRACEGKVQN